MFPAPIPSRWLDADVRENKRAWGIPLPFQGPLIATELLHQLLVLMWLDGELHCREDEPPKAAT